MKESDKIQYNVCHVRKRHDYLTTQDLEKVANTIHQRLTELFTQQKNINDKIKDYDHLIPELNKKIKEITNSITNINTNLSQNSTKIENISTQVSSIQNTYVKKADLDQTLKGYVLRDEIHTLVSQHSSSFQKNIQVQIEQHLQQIKNLQENMQKIQGTHVANQKITKEYRKQLETILGLVKRRMDPHDPLDLLEDEAKLQSFLFNNIVGYQLEQKIQQLGQINNKEGNNNINHSSYVNLQNLSQRVNNDLSSVGLAIQDTSCVKELEGLYSCNNPNELSKKLETFVKKCIEHAKISLQDSFGQKNINNTASIQSILDKFNNIKKF